MTFRSCPIWGNTAYISVEDSNIPRIEQPRSDTPLIQDLVDDDPINISLFTIALSTQAKAYAIDKGAWTASQCRELDAFVERKAWTPRPRNSMPIDAHIIETRWVYDHKEDQFGAETSKKSRLVAQSFSQRPGKDFVDICSCSCPHISAHVYIFFSSTWAQNTSNRCQKCLLARNFD